MNWDAFDITGPVDIFTTPLIVWKQIATCHAIEIKDSALADPEQLKKLQSAVLMRKLTISRPPKREELIRLRHFVNPSVTNWTPASLQQAINFMLNTDSSVLTEKKYEISAPTPENPKTINILMAYRFCRELKVPLTHDATIGEMVTGLRIWSQPVMILNEYVALACSLVNSRNSRSLWMRGLLAVIHTADSAPLPSYTDLNIANEELREQSYKHRPTTIAGLVCWVAHKYMTNPLRTELPLLTMVRLLSGKENSQNELQHIIDARLPLVYSARQLNIMSQAFGLEPEPQGIAMFNNITNHIMLQHTFYLARYHPNVTAESTCIYGLNIIRHGKKPETKLDAFSILESKERDENIYMECDELLVYGTSGEAGVAITVRELAESFEKQGNYYNFLAVATEGGRVAKPTGNFDRHSVVRLRHLLTELPTTENTTYLSQVLSMLDLRAAEDAKIWMSVKEKYFTADEKTKIVINELITKLVRVSMFMRSWSGTGPYPIESAPAGNQDQVDQRVGMAIIELQDAVRDAGEWGALIYDLPLVVYRKCEFVRPYDTLPKTIRQRIETVKIGANGNTDSCIRISSMWLVSTIVYLQQILGLQLLCSLARLETIT